MLVALYSIGFGVHIWARAFHGQPLLWAGLDNSDALMFGQAMSLSGLVHALGVRINGHWRWSPALRLVGMAGHAAAFAFLTIHGGDSTASYTYAWGVGMAVFGAWSAGRDLRRETGGAQWSLN